MDVVRQSECRQCIDGAETAAFLPKEARRDVESKQYLDLLFSIMTLSALLNSSSALI